MSELFTKKELDMIFQEVDPFATDDIKIQITEIKEQMQSQSTEMKEQISLLHKQNDELKAMLTLLLTTKH